MERTRLRELTQPSDAVNSVLDLFVEMERTRLRELTHLDELSTDVEFTTVEMERTRLRELTLIYLFAQRVCYHVSRNGAYPIKGIDTFR